MAVGGETVAAGSVQNPRDIPATEAWDGQQKAEVRRGHGAEILQLDVNKDSQECECVCVFINAALPALSSPALTSTLTDLCHSYNLLLQLRPKKMDSEFRISQNQRSRARTLIQRPAQVLTKANLVYHVYVYLEAYTLCYR